MAARPAGQSKTTRRTGQASEEAKKSKSEVDVDVGDARDRAVLPLATSAVGRLAVDKMVRLQATSYRLRVTGYELQATSYRLPRASQDKRRPTLTHCSSQTRAVQIPTNRRRC